MSYGPRDRRLRLLRSGACALFYLAIGAASSAQTFASDGPASAAPASGVPASAAPLPGAPLPTAPATATLTSAAKGCLASGNGYLRARIRGALKLDIDLHDGELECDGGTRPDSSGIRVSFAGPVRSDGRRLRMVFGVRSATEGNPGHELPTNLTVIFEGEQRLFATRGDDKCTVDSLTQERLGALGGAVRSYRVVARGFCIAPAGTLDDKEKILVSSFDFAGKVTFEDP